MKKLISMLLLTVLITAGCSTSTENVEPETAADLPERVTMETILPEEIILETETETALETEIPDSEAVFYVSKEESQTAEKPLEIEESSSQEEDMEISDTEESDSEEESEYDCESCENFDGDGYCIKCGLPGPDVPEETHCAHEHVERAVMDDGSIDHICTDCGMDGMYDRYFDHIGVDEEYEKQAGIFFEDETAEEVIGE